MKKNKMEKQKAKEYEKYVSQFTPGSRFLSNGIKAFIIGGLICLAAYVIQGWLLKSFALEQKTAGTIVTIGLVLLAQILTGIGVFDKIAKFAGAGVIVPITGFANSMVATAMEFKSEGAVLGVGSKLFLVAGPVIVCGISTSVIVGVIYYIMSLFNFALPWM